MKKTFLAKKILHFLFTGFLLFLSLVYFINLDIGVGILFLISGVLTIPGIQTKIGKILNKNIKRPVKLGIGLFLFFLLFFSIGNDYSQQYQQTQKLYTDLQKRAEIDNKLLKNTKNKTDNIGQLYLQSQKQGNLVLSDTYDLIQTLQKAEDNSKISFISRVYAKKRRSLRYYVPIFGALIKAKHQTVETARAGIYKAVTDPKNPEGRQILKSYKINDPKELLDLPDEKVLQLSRDPVLHGYVNMTKVVVDLGKAAVTLEVEASQSVLGGGINVISDTTKNIVKERVLNGKLQSVGEDLKSKKKGIVAIKTRKKSKKYLFAVNQKSKQKIQNIQNTLKNQILEKKRQNLGVKVQNELAKDLVLENTSPNLVAYKSDQDLIDLELDNGKWDLDLVDKKEVKPVVAILKCPFGAK